MPIGLALITVAFVVAQQTPVDASRLVGWNVVLSSSSEQAEQLKEVLALPAAREKDWKLPANSPVRKTFRTRIIEGIRYWIAESLLEPDLFEAAGRLWKLASENGMAIRGRLSDFERQDQEAIVKLLSNGAAFGIAGSLKSALNNPDAQIFLDFSVQVREADGITILDQSDSKTKRLPKGEAAKMPPEVPVLTERETVLRIFPRANDPGLRTFSEQAYELLEEWRSAQRATLEKKMLEKGLEHYRKGWADPKSWDGVSPTTFGNLDSNIQQSARRNFEGRRTFTGSEKVGPLKVSLILGIGSYDGNVFRGTGSSVLITLG
ncbi:hypothetical protein EON79_00400 [bacterium]|nr:MAG: hypothetical protein EON79_00400 [bacterium]